MSVEQLREFPPFYQLQSGQTKVKQIEFWEQRILQYFKQKNTFFADFQTLLQSKVCQNADGSLQIQKQLLQEVLLQMESNSNLIFQDQRKQSFYVFDNKLRQQFVQTILKQAGDDVLTISEIEEFINNDKNLQKMPQQLIIMLLQNEGQQAKRLQLIYDKQSKIQGVKIL